MDSKVSEKDMREVYFQAFGKEYDSADRKQAPLPLEIAYLVALKKLKREGKYAGGGEITNDTYYESVNHFIYFCMNYPRNFLDAFGSLKNHLSNKFKDYYNKYGTYGVMIQFYAELDAENRRVLTDYSLKNYKGTPISSDISEVEYFNSVNHFIFFCFNFPSNFMDAFSSHLKVHLSSKWTNAYEKKGSVGAMIYFWSELDNENREKLANWVKANYTGTKLYEVGGALGDVAGMLPSPLPMFTIQAMADGGSVKINFSSTKTNGSLVKSTNFENGLFVWINKLNNIYKEEYKYGVYNAYDERKIVLFKTLEDAENFYNQSVSKLEKESSISKTFSKNSFSNGGQLELFANGGGITDSYEIDFNNLENINKGDFIIQTYNNSIYLLKVLKIRDKELVFQNINKETITPNSYSIGDLNGSSFFRTLTEKEKSNLFGDAEKLDLDRMIEKLYTIYSESSKFENRKPESVLYTYIRNFDLPIIKRYQIFKNKELVYDTLQDDFMKTPYGKKNYNYSNGGGVKSDYYIFEGVDNLNGNPLYRVESTSESENEYVGEWHTDRNDAEKELNSLSKKPTQSLGVVKVIFENPEYNYTTNVGVNVTEEEARNYFVGKMFNVGIYPKQNMQKAIDIEFSKSKEKYADGGETEFPIYKYGKIDGKPFEVIGVNYENGIVRVKNFSENGIKEMTISEWIPLTFELGTPASFIENGREVSGEVVMRDGKRAISLYKDDNYVGDSERIRFFNQIDLNTLKSSMNREKFSFGGFLLGAGAGIVGSYLYNNATLEKDKKGVKIEVKKPKKIFKYGGEIEQRVKDKLSRNFALPFEIVVYVPSTQDADKIISKEEFNNRIVEVETYLAKLFGGFSANPVDGGYNSEDKGLITEDVFKVYSFASRDGFEPKMEELVIQIKEWCKVWGQEAIGLEFEGDLFYVES